MAARKRTLMVGEQIPAFPCFSFSCAWLALQDDGMDGAATFGGLEPTCPHLCTVTALACRQPITERDSVIAGRFMRSKIIDTPQHTWHQRHELYYDCGSSSVSMDTAPSTPHFGVVSHSKCSAVVLM
jgi:hypothetical protein